MATLTEQDVAFFRDQGYFVARGLFDTAEIARLREGYDHVIALLERGGLALEYLTPAGPEVHIHVQAPRETRADDARFLRKVQWPALIHPAFEEIRNSPKFPRPRRAADRHDAEAVHQSDQLQDARR